MSTRRFLSLSEAELKLCIITRGTMPSNTINEAHLWYKCWRRRMRKTTDKPQLPARLISENCTAQKDSDEYIQTPLHQNLLSASHSQPTRQNLRARALTLCPPWCSRRGDRMLHRSVFSPDDLAMKKVLSINIEWRPYMSLTHLHASPTEPPYL